MTNCIIRELVPSDKTSPGCKSWPGCSCQSPNDKLPFQRSTGQQWSLPRHCQRGSHRSVPQLVQGPYSDTSASTCLSCLRSWDDGSHFQSRSLFLGSKLPKCYSRNQSFNFQNLSLFGDFSECHWRRSSAIEGPNRHAKSLCDRQWQLKVLKAAWCLALTLTQPCCQAMSGQSFHLDNVPLDGWRVFWWKVDVIPWVLLLQKKAQSSMRYHGTYQCKNGNLNGPKK